MSEWPEGWFRGQGASRPAGEADLGETVRTPAGPPAAGRPAARRSAWPEQPPPRTGRAPNPWQAPVLPPAGPDWYERAPQQQPQQPRGPRGPRRRRGWLRPRRILGVLALVVVLLVAGVVGSYVYLSGKLQHASILTAFPGRPAPGSGTNWLIAGSDSRQGLTRQQERQLSTGNLDASGAGRSDTIMILHIPAGGGRPLLISIPRDSYVSIPGHGDNKINAAYSIGGPALLARTVQASTGLYINHFMDIGFGGFVHAVDAVGGVRMCLPAPIHDKASGLNLKAGCQVLTGGQALAYVRDRHTFTTQDLQREQDQRIFLSALLRKMTSTGVLLNPLRSLPAASGVAGNLTVDSGSQLYQLYSVARALRDPKTTTVPIANANYPTSVGDAVLWNATQSRELFTALQSGQPVPAALITGSKQGS